MRRIQLTQGRFALVDNEDYDEIASYKWCAHQRQNSKNCYAVRTVRLSFGRYKTVYMHRAILSPGPRLEVDHANGNGLDNRRSNIRACTHSENIRNRAKRAKASSQFKGVSWNVAARRWAANIHSGPDRQIFLGYFADEVEAAKSYDAAARHHFGRFARLNFDD